MEIFLCFASSALTLLCFPQFNLSILAWIALAPLAYLVVELQPEHPFLWGWLSGTTAYAGILSWLIVTFQAAHQSLLLATAALLALAAYLGFFWGAWAWFLSVIPAKAGIQSVVRRWTPASAGVTTLAGAAAWVALEYLRTYLFTGFPWTLLGDSQIHSLPMVQIASLTGVYGVSFLLVVTSLSLVGWARNKPRNLSLPLLLVALSWGYGHYRLTHTSESGQPITVALLQGSIDQYKKWDQAYVQEIELTYEVLVARAKVQNPQIIVWPETSVPGYLLQDRALTTWLAQVIRNSGCYHIIGTPFMNGKDAYNSAFSIDPSGRLLGQYSKHHLVPFGEIVPFGDTLGRWIHVLNELGGFTAGQESTVLTVGPAEVGINICYEAIFPALVRKSVAQGAELIANLTNDGWYMKTAAPYQHFAPNVFRAIENDRWLVRADNTGISAIIDPLGHVTAASPIFQPEIVTGQIYLRRTRTFYTRFGDVFAWICIIFCIA